MDHILEMILGKGFHGIAYRILSSYEQKSGYQDEITEIEFVATDSEGSHRHITATVTKSFAPRRQGQSIVMNIQNVIPRSDYQAWLESLGGQKDTREYFARVETDKQAQQAKSDEYRRLVPRCPRCGSAMAIRRRSDNSPFWGCIAFHDNGCRGTRDLTRQEAVRLKAIGYL